MKTTKVLFYIFFAALFLPERSLAEENVSALEKLSAPPLASAQAGRLRYMDISFVSLFTVGTSTADEGDIERLEGGAHEIGRASCRERV